MYPESASDLLTPEQMECLQQLHDIAARFGDTELEARIAPLLTGSGVSTSSIAVSPLAYVDKYMFGPYLEWRRVHDQQVRERSEEDCRNSIEALQRELLRLLATKHSVPMETILFLDVLGARIPAYHNPESPAQDIALQLAHILVRMYPMIDIVPRIGALSDPLIARLPVAYVASTA